VGETPWDPESYALEIREEIRRYDELQQRLVEATKATRPDTSSPAESRPPSPGPFSNDRGRQLSESGQQLPAVLVLHDYLS
jgi:hypothetical protein